MNRNRWILILMTAAGLLTLTVCPWIGSQSMNVDRVFDTHSQFPDRIIFFHLRLPRVLTAFLAGMGLSISGMIFQALFRNALAAPYTLGVASGASAGASLYILLGLTFSWLGVPGLTLFAFAGAVITIVMVFGIARLQRSGSTATLLLAGIAISLTLTSAILFMQYVSNLVSSMRILRWIMGGLDVLGPETPLNILPFVLTGTTIAALHVRELNLLTLGDDLAISRGVNVRRLQGVMFVATSLMIGGIVAECGPIGFVGLMCPHICRLLVGADHRVLMPASLLFGGIFLVVCDTLARSVLSAAQLPVGIITAMLGGPFFLWLLVRGRQSGLALA